MSDDRFNVIVHHDGEVEAHEEAAEVEIGDANGLNSDVEVEGEIEMETMPESDYSCRGKFENRARHLIELSNDEWHSEELLSGPDSESETTEDEENNDERTGCGPFQTFVMPKSMADYKWEVGTAFLDNNHFKDATRAYAIHAGRNLKFLKNDSNRVRVGCFGAQNKCQWSVYCSYVRSRKIWQLRKLLDVHSCSREFKINIIKVKWLSETLDQTLIENPKLKINDVRQRALRKWNTHVSISTARKARAMVADIVDGSFK